ncbi:hypothetical protein [Mycolicibacterium houstonense]|uniref:hypothetical protein n=1 Tax=Mycolicibacterium houstonense TaxID=146021 RepID=UPI0021F33240|nr:hypothetical protein [Mycolicibacterium houstonense]
MPGVYTSSILQPASASLIITGSAPTVAITQHRLLSPAPAELQLIGSHPALEETFRPVAAALTVTGGVPDVRITGHKFIAPSPATLGLSGSAPGIATTSHRLIAPTAAPMAITGGQPAVFASDQQSVAPSPAVLSLTGGEPFASVGLVVRPDPASLTLSGWQPAVATPVRAQPGTAVLTLVGSHPALGTTVRPSAPALTLVGSQPTIQVSDHKRLTPTGTVLTLTGNAASVTATAHKVVTPSGPALTVIGGTPTVTVSNHKLVSPTTSPLAFTGGTPTVTVASAAVSIIATNTSTASTSIAIPAHQVGDIIILVAAQTGVSAAPTKPAAGGTVPAWVTIDQTSAAGGMHTVSHVATATNTTSGSWTGADAMAAIVLRGQRSTNPVGGHAITANIGTTFTAPAVTLAVTDGTSVLIHAYATSNLTSAWPAAPSGYTKQSSAGSTSTKGGMVLTKNVTTSDGSVAVTAGGGFSVWQAASIEVAAH